METSRIDGVKAPPHRGTPRSHALKSSIEPRKTLDVEHVDLVDEEHARHDRGPALLAPLRDLGVDLGGTDIVAKPPRPSRETHGRSCGRVDAVEATRHRVDVFMKTTSSSSSFFTLSH